ncbi:LD-carboxypeptidase [Nonomuraea sp. NBC_00507]|uniref:S66 family peptidase n=1 Tax=Nonomuraea sp. NBC_00507 TaxID=2976002 RepID=UPI002E170D1F
MHSPSYPGKPKPGDRVAVVSPSAGLPEIFPMPYELGLRRLRDDFGLVPVEYPTTRRMGSSAADRARDLHAAFADPDIAAVLSSIGGDDQITVLAHLDRDLLKAHPKPFFGYSDATNMLAFLWDLGIVGYHGGAVMTEFGRAGAMHPLTAESLHAALFTTGPYELRAATAYTDVDRPWDEPETFASEPPMTPCPDGWTWHNADRVVEGVSWGGCLEIVSWLLMAGRAIRPADEHEGGVLFFETSEEMPSATEVYRILRCMGERGLLRRFGGVMVGRARGWSLERRTTPEERIVYARDQREAVLRAFAEYNDDALIVFDVDFGHTDPKLVIPYGGRIRLDGPARAITVSY